MLRGSLLLQRLVFDVEFQLLRECGLLNVIGIMQAHFLIEDVVEGHEQLVPFVDRGPRLPSHGHDLRFNLLKEADVLVALLIALLEAAGCFGYLVEDALAIYLVGVHDCLHAVRESLQLFHLLLAFLNALHELLLFVFRLAEHADGDVVEAILIVILPPD